MRYDAVPLDLEGTIRLPQIPEREFVTKYLQSKHIQNEHLDNYLFDLLQDFLEALADKDFAKLAEITESRFLQKIQTRKDQLKSKEWFNYTREDFYDPVKVTCLDKLFIKGLGVDRATNDGDFNDYIKVTKMEERGLRQYIHKYSLGMQDFYFG